MSDRDEEQTAMQKPDAAHGEVPDWVDSTPDETSYCLVMMPDERGATPLQDIGMSRKQFVVAKRVVAILQGILPMSELENLFPVVLKRTEEVG